MAPTEATILATFLLNPAPLPTVINLKTFAELFPPSQQKSPHIRTLYRDLQHSRALVTDAVEQNISTEIKRGNAQRRAVIRSRRLVDKTIETDDEVVVETAVSIS
jgi:centromere-localized protein 2